MTANRRRWQFPFFVLLLAGSFAALTGCGGGSSSVVRSAPTAETKSRMRNMQGLQQRTMAMNGTQNTTAALAAGGGNAGGGGGVVGANSHPPLPLFGAFLNRAFARPQAAAGGRASRRNRSGPEFFYEPYLGLWIELVETTNGQTVNFFEDEAKTKAAGNAVVQFSAPDTFPTTYHAEVTVTAGTLKGTHSLADSTYNADGTGESRYDSTYADGWRDQSENRNDSEGSGAWSSRSEQPGGAFYLSSGSYQPTGASTYRTENSDGWKNVYKYNPDGSGTGTMEGPAPGLPASVVWDTNGKATVTYADGSTEVFANWTFFYGGDAESGVSDGGTGGGGMSDTPPPPGDDATGGGDNGGRAARLKRKK